LKQPRILCLYPPHEDKVDYLMGLPYITSYLLSKGFQNIFCLDAPALSLSRKDVIDFIKKHCIEVVLVSVPFTPWTDSALKMMEELKSLDLYVVVGGVMPTLMPELFTEHANVVVVGDGEKVIHKILTNPPKNSIIHGETSNLDALPFPAWQLFPTEKYEMGFPTAEKAMPIIMLTRGCPFNCNFCANWILSGRKVSYRKAENVIREIKRNIKDFGISAFVVRDEVFTLNRNLVMEFCQKVVSEKLEIKWWCQTRANIVDEELLRCMKEAGCVGVSFGVESGDAEIRRKIGKGISFQTFREAVSIVKEQGILCHCGFIVGHPWETIETIKTTALVADSLDPDTIGIAICTPYPKTRLRQEIREDQIVAKKWSDYVTRKVTYIPDGLVGHDLKAIRELVFLDFHSRKLKRLKTLLVFNRRYFFVYSVVLWTLFAFHRFFSGTLLSSFLLAPAKLTKKVGRFVERSLCLARHNFS